MQSLQKPGRIQSRETIQQIRKEAEHRCQYEDPVTGEICDHPAEGEPHHIKTRGAGGSDVRENLIQLCGEHHRLAQDGKIDRNELIRIVAKREGKTSEEIAAIIQLPYREPEPPASQPPKLEDLIQAYIQVDEQEQESRFVKGQLLDAMLAAGATQKYLSQELGVSPSQIRELVHVYRTFSDPVSRVPTLSWYHHRVAARSSDPAKFIALAADQSLSIRNLRKEILVSEGSGHLAEQDEAEERKKAEKCLTAVREILIAGGPVAEWLTQELKNLLNGVDASDFEKHFERAG
ncbi:HNH endonuclease signature motif containing protein [Cohnella thermotolerans]|uniref:HNH endonuclease signature motif containing protein n=1 Tax=Cohnella thermotolerans TaxID=329858 RepID=UPI000479B107|nr:HNH endonuclease signature motif containing protein [Cohnella thermotolerans]